MLILQLILLGSAAVAGCKRDADRPFILAKIKEHFLDFLGPVPQNEKIQGGQRGLHRRHTLDTEVTRSLEEEGISQVIAFPTQGKQNHDSRGPGRFKTQRKSAIVILSSNPFQQMQEQILRLSSCCGSCTEQRVGLDDLLGHVQLYDSMKSYSSELHSRDVHAHTNTHILILF